MNKFGFSLKITNWCNLKCAHCSEFSSRNVHANIMPIDDVEKYVRQFRDINVPKYNQLVFTGGESMAPYSRGDYSYVPTCISIAQQADFVPYFKTNGVWGADAKLRNTILNDFADAAYNQNKMMTLEISFDEFHNNINQVCRIISNVADENYFARAIRICLIGLNTQQSKENFIRLLTMLAMRNKMKIIPDFKYNKFTGYRDGANVGVNVFFDFNTPVFNIGRAARNKLGQQDIDGMPTAQYGNCFQIDNSGVATLNYKWRTPVANQPVSVVLNKLLSMMYNRNK